MSYRTAPAYDENAKENSAGNAMTVSAAMDLAKRSLESITVTLVGEVSEVSVKAGYKAAYFTVKDSSSALPCMMWNNRYRASGVQLAVGQLVQLTGRFTLYAAKGRMNFDVFSLALAGEGDLRLKVANIARKLQAEGLTDPARKRALPKLPQRIGLVTSPRSAAVHDVLRTLRRRFPIAQVLLAGVPVEGANAPAGLIEGVNRTAEAGAQVILVVRGGGSFEDMMPFNDEALARAIAACPVPVVTGIGHEVDTSIADMVSDFRASTPTAAAEAVSPAPEALAGWFDARADALRSASSRLLDQWESQLDRLASRPVFEDPLQMFANDAQALDIALDRLCRALPLAVQGAQNEVDAREERLKSIGQAAIARFDGDLSVAAGRLNDLSPLAVLSRGYSITRLAQGPVVKSANQVEVGDPIEITLEQGQLACTVTDITSA